MRVLNLDNNFNPFSSTKTINIDFKRFDFPSGCEPHIKINQIRKEKVIITTRIQKSDDLITLLLAVDALKRIGITEMELFLPYLPFARQDRVMVAGEPLSIKVISDLINAHGFENVTVFDPHSDVCMALINNSRSISNHAFVKMVLAGKSDYMIASPDAGAYKKIFKLCQFLNYEEEILMCNKLRDVSNGVIRSVTVSHENLEGKEIYIVDDILDGGNTFILLAQELKRRGAKCVNLIVSHGIFSKGESELMPFIDRIYTTDSFKDIESTYIKQTKLCSIL